MSADETQEQTPRRPYRQGEALRDALAALAARAATRPSVTISRDAAGNYSYDVRVTDDDPAVALESAALIEKRLLLLYPSVTPPDPLKASLTRNAKGETQVEVEYKGDNATEIVLAEYDRMTARYPSASGKVTNDLPPVKS